MGSELHSYYIGGVLIVLLLSCPPGCKPGYPVKDPTLTGEDGLLTGRPHYILKETHTANLLSVTSN